jgi:hypothetical protein
MNFSFLRPVKSPVYYFTGQLLIFRFLLSLACEMEFRISQAEAREVQSYFTGLLHRTTSPGSFLL